MKLAALACKHILLKLQLLSEQSATPMRTEGQLVYGSGTTGLRTREKQGKGTVSTRVAGTQSPGTVAASSDAASYSLYAHYLPLMRQAIASEDLERTELLHRQAWEDYLAHKGNAVQRFDTEESAVKYLLGELVGVDADRAAIRMKASEQTLSGAKKWVREQRRRNQRDPETGRQKAARTVQERRVYELRDSGKTQCEIAEILGISQPRVSKVLAGISR
jgi:DNA-binding CsgD family transcriptional regulator